MRRNTTPSPGVACKADPATSAGRPKGNTGQTIHAATASSITPKPRLTQTIHAPARGSSEPADSPTSSSGTLMPQAMANSATPPSTTSRVWLM